VKTIETTLYHRLFLPERSEAPRHPAIILLHGRGADEEDLLGLAPGFDDRFLLISPRAPYEYPYGGYTWFGQEASGIPNEAQFHEGSQLLSRFIHDAIAGYPIDPRRVILFGFSMGTIMSYTFALTHPGVVRGVAACSGYCPEDPRLPYRWGELDGTEFFITHGTEDPVIPVAMARKTRDLLAANGARFTYREYPLPHAIGDDAMRDIARWLAAFLDYTD
jgi:phospholipase/carboxylesterase